MNLLFVSYGGGHVAALLPVAELAKSVGHRVTFIGLTTAGNVLRGAGFPFISLSDLWEFAAPDAQEYGEELCAEISPGGPVSVEESIAYHGISFADLVDVIGEEKARQKYTDKGRHAFLPARFFERVLRYMKPDVLIATNSPRAEQAAILASGNIGIPSVCVVDLFALQEVKWIGVAGYASRVCVLNESVREMFLRVGREPNEIVTTGNPAFETLTGADAARAGAQLKLARGWGDDKKTVLWASQEEPARHPFEDVQGDPQLPRRIEEELRKIVAQRDDVRLVVRYHPSEQVEFKHAPNVEFSPRDEPLAVLLNAVDVVVVTASTVGLEAAIVGLPVISVDCSIWTPDTLFAEQGISQGVPFPEDLPKAISSLIVQNASGSYGKNAVLKSEEQTASQRILDVIEAL